MWPYGEIVKFGVSYNVNRMCHVCKIVKVDGLPVIYNNHSSTIYMLFM